MAICVQANNLIKNSRLKVMKINKRQKRNIFIHINAIEYVEIHMRNAVFFKWKKEIIFFYGSKCVFIGPWRANRKKITVTKNIFGFTPFLGRKWPRLRPLVVQSFISILVFGNWKIVLYGKKKSGGGFDWLKLV